MEAVNYVAMWSKRPHAADDLFSPRLPDCCGRPLREHLEGRSLRGREVDVRACQATNERELEHLLKPRVAQRGVAEDAHEDLVELAKVEQRLVDVEGEKIALSLLHRFARRRFELDL